MKRFTDEPILSLIDWIEQRKAQFPDGDVSFEIMSPSASFSATPGKMVEANGVRYIHRTYQNVLDLAEVTRCRLKSVHPSGPWVQVVFTPTCETSQVRESNDSEKYGVQTAFAQIRKLEDPSVAADMRRALVEAGVRTRNSLIDLGVNRGDELQLVHELNPAMQCTGVDHCASALDVARERFISQQFEFIEFDINRIDEMYLKRYDILFSLGTLHSPGIDSKRVFMWCVQHLLNPDGSVVIGFPNCRWVEGQPVYGGRTKNRREQDLSLVVKDVYFVKKYLQQHRFIVTVFGKYYLFVVGVKQKQGNVS
ncbi:MAG: methyltransferase domain-containing protein [Deltaproteobacteria bacterium]|nr:methyltransferase domain-containing protein [Deltaproteobacteria bacterium]MBN2672381.1 methyltransferase domain-containing protein [Deltaproteobacteria bacterium]